MYNIFSMLTLQVFLDEVNTSSCLGLFKEIILDRTFDGVVRTYVHIHVVFGSTCICS